jgi:hypothetical protein
MKISKSQNSILVLATLGVYFGLVLVGATPQVLASAAMTREFSVKDEIEVKEDLDNKPDDDRSPVTASVQVYLDDVEYFLASLGRLKRKGGFDPKKDHFDVSQVTLLPCVDSNLAGRYTPLRFETSSEPSRPALERFTQGMVYGYSLGDCVQNNEFPVAAADSRFTFGLDASAFTVKVGVRKQSLQRAVELAQQLQSTLRLYSNPTNTALRQKVVENTTFRTDNDQVFVVTRLPRAGLDTLFAQDAK